MEGRLAGQADADNPLPSQYVDETEPPAIQNEEGEDEWQVEKIVDSKWERRGRGQPRRKYLVKWQGYQRPTWEPEDFVEDTAAMERFITAFPDKPHPPPEANDKDGSLAGAQQLKKGGVLSRGRL